MTAVIEREVITEFLELYHENVCLWDTSCKLYNNKDARNQALQILVEKLKVIDPNATIAIVKKKLENMRAAYKRERKKIQESKSTGADAGTVYVPTLWYYEYLTFLDEKDPINKREMSTISFCDDDEEGSETEHKIYRPPPSKRRATSLWNKQEKLIEMVQNLLIVQDNTAESYGRVVGLQLKEMTEMQRCIAEKLISDVVFYGRLGKLSVHSSISLNNNFCVPAPSQSPSTSLSTPYNNFNSP